MIRKNISREFNLKDVSANSVREEMKREAIKDDGIFSTFRFDTKWLTTSFLTKVTLQYCKFDGDGCSWIPMQKKIFYKTCPELSDVQFPYISPETMKNVTDRIKMDMVKKDNAIWSTIKFEPLYDHFAVSYEKVYTTEDPHLTTSRYLRTNAGDVEIENTKKTLRRIQENSYYGIPPRNAGLTCHFDEKLKEDIKASLGLWKAKAEKDTNEKEKTDMNITLMIVPEGMNENFVKGVKANFQSNNSQRLFVASTDIDYSCEREPIKTKYDLFENWITTGKVDHIYFMLGFEKDPDVRAFESFVRGITELSMKTVVNVIYQKDDIENDIHHLRTLYFDEADAKEDAARATGSVVKEANAMKEVYSLDDNSLDIIKHSRGKIDTSNELVINEIMDVAFFAEDEAAKPAKKGGTK